MDLSNKNAQLSDICISEICISEIRVSQNLTEISERYYQLLLMADPDKKQIDDYLPESRILIASWREKSIAIAVLAKEQNCVEIKNIAVAESFQNKGIAKLLLARCEKIAGQLNMSWLKIATGNSSTHQLKLYQNYGFRPYSIERNFFANYPLPIVENGIRCLDKICLRMPIKKN